MRFPSALVYYMENYLIHELHQVVYTHKVA